MLSASVHRIYLARYAPVAAEALRQQSRLNKGALSNWIVPESLHGRVVEGEEGSQGEAVLIW